MPKLDINPYLSSEDFPDGTGEIEIISPHRMKTAEDTGFDQDKAEIDVKLADGQIKTWALNKTSALTLKSKFGENTDDWVGKKTEVFTQDMIVKGTPRTVLFAKPEKKE